ncbi:MAG: acyl-CoA dehydrogenase family protein [Phycisphaerae bacterium]|nr:MAG: acyl-CoA dehydrogenase [Planctomycetota bacterium]KAB2936625.1 MAG: acyl-CoA dehydrogenase [Phycisphaerae bacterium]MBE7458478.1 acyl-CoA dehydrogenase family protein [Planctomycetia bacterium]MCK6464890.1 acyl-CoA dehydrogenase family protein [Phycisphaerae bacterium]MCL4719221.1 acyl-CoA dehydrogenase family protein [Phycisphaerae bacterium]
MPDVILPDLFDFNSCLTDDERQVRDTVARWVDDRVLPIIGECFEKERFPMDLVPEMAEMGLFGPTFADYGCAGLNNVCYGLIMQELERGDSGVRSFASVQSGLCMYPIHAYGSPEQKQRWLPEMARGRKIGCFGLTEPDGGSDPGTMKTRAVKKGGDWVINGAKMWITNGSLADVAVVWAATDDGIRGFLVEKGMPGYTTRDIPHKFSLRASITSELFFDNVKVPDSNRLPRAEGLGAPLSCLTQARYGIAWGGVGAAMACYRECLEFAKQRVLFGTTLDRKQMIQVRLADMVRQITAAQFLCLQLGRLKDAGTMHHSQVSLAKWHCVRMGLDVARDARDLLGAGGISIECCPIRHALNLESVITYEGTETIHQLIVGREITGHGAF